ncbi:VQ motif-containing protein 31, partial [Cucurbita argyrosperma subsp. sororia]
MEKGGSQSRVVCTPLTTFIQTDTTTFREPGEHPSYVTSPVGTPSKILSKLSTGEDEKESNKVEEEKAIKERGFYLHPSPRSKPGYAQPEAFIISFGISQSNSAP